MQTHCILACVGILYLQKAAQLRAQSFATSVFKILKQKQENG